MKVCCPNPTCGKTVVLPEGFSGGAVRCGRCRARIRVNPADPGGSSPSAPAEAKPSGEGSPPPLGRFRPLARLGEGAFGAVYRAYDPGLEREVALKILHPGKLNNPLALGRFLREARAAAGLRHPHIVPVYEADADGGRPYIASAFVPGQTLAEALAAGPLEYPRAARLARALAEALAYAHEQGIVHRDVKPANVLLDGAGEPLLLDFGLARRQEGEEKLTQEGALLGTPAYMAPEQARGQAGEPLPASDQYSLGVVLYEMLCGRTPFTGPPPAVLYSTLHHEPTPPRALVPGVPRDLETICLKALAKRPEQRYPSCRELAEDLRRWLAGEPIKARRRGPFERLTRWVRQEPFLVAAGLLAALALATVTVVASANADRFAARAAPAAEARRQAERARQVAREARQEAEAAERLARDFREKAEAQRNQTKGALQAADQAAGAENSALRTVDAERGRLQAVQARLREKRAAEAQAREREKAIEAEITKQRREVELASRRLLVMPGSVVALSPDGKCLFADRFRDPGFRDAQTGELLQPLEVGTGPANKSIRTAAFSPDGKRLATTFRDAKTVTLWDRATGKETFTFRQHLEPVCCVAFSPDGRRVASGSGVKRRTGKVYVWDPDTGKEDFRLHGHTGLVNALAFSPDGKLLASAGDDGTVRLWDARTGKAVRTLNLEGSITAVAFRPDGQRLAAAGYEVKVWNVATGAELLTLPGRKSVAYSRDGRLLAAPGNGGGLRVWDAGTGKEVLTLDVERTYEKVAFHPDGKRLVGVWYDCCEGAILVWAVVPFNP